jgi:3-hydroxybutyryl-CoA dehydrogenase
MLIENVASVSELDRIYRDGIGFKMGPFELVDLTGMDVSHPVSESIYHQYYEEARYRPSVITRQRYIAKQLGRKTGKGFYDYTTGEKQGEDPAVFVEKLDHYPTVWIAADLEKDQSILKDYLEQQGITLETGPEPSEQALVLIASYGEDATTAALRYQINPKQVVCIDLLYGFNKHRTLMPTLITDSKHKTAAHSIFNLDGTSLSMIQESTGFVAQRVLAMIVNLGCDIAQQGVASVEDINAAVRLGLGYPYGPIEWGDKLGADKILLILDRMSAISRDPRYRPSAWLRRRVQLKLPLVTTV